MLKKLFVVAALLGSTSAFADVNSCSGCEILSGLVANGTAFPGTPSAHSAIGLETPTGFVEIIHPGNSEADFQALLGNKVSCNGMYSQDHNAFWIFTINDCNN